MTFKTKYNYLIKLLAFLKVPLLFQTSPSVVELSDKVATIYLPLKRKNKNHVGSMYFGALAMGAELSIALTAIKDIQENKSKVQFIFKDFKANFLKRPNKGVYFTCEQAAQISELVNKAENTSERVEQLFQGYAYIDTKTKEPVFEYELTLSLKKR